MSKSDDVYQAVIICESFRNYFGPIGKRLAPCLIPLVDKPILFYTLNALRVAGIQEAFIFCSSQSDQIRAFVRDYRTQRDDVHFKLTVHSAEHYFSVGEIIRDIFAKAIIRSDFVLIHGDTVCNLPFKHLLDEHKALKAKDKQCVMTLLYQRILPSHPARRKADDSLIALDGNTDRLLFYEKRYQNKCPLTKFNLTLSILKDNGFVKILYDLLDTHISLCSPAVVSLFADNFDYQTMKDFVKGIMNQEEILGNTIYVKIVKDSHYASRANHPIAFDQLAQDMLKRWTYPFVPDLECDFIHRRHQIYKPFNSSVSLDSLCSNVSIGFDTEISHGCTIHHSIIGNNCKIGSNIKMKNVYVMDNVQIEDNCQLEKCIIGKNAFLRPYTVIRGGCIIGEDVVLGPFITIKEGSMIEYDPENDTKFDSSLVGYEGKGTDFNKRDKDENDDDDDDASVDEAWGKKQEENNWESDSSGSNDLDDDLDNSNVDIVDIGKALHLAGDGSDEAKSYYSEVVDSLIRGIEDNIKCENLTVELNASKHAYNIQFKDVSSLVSRAIMDAIITTSKVDNMPNLVKVKKTVNKLASLIKNYVKDDTSRSECLKAMEEYTLSNYSSPSMVAAFVHLINTMYSEDVLSEETILNWYNSCEAVYSSVSDKEHEMKHQKALRAEKILKKFIEWLEEAEEETDSE